MPDSKGCLEGGLDRRYCVRRYNGLPTGWLAPLRQLARRQIAVSRSLKDGLCQQAKKKTRVPTW